MSGVRSSPAGAPRAAWWEVLGAWLRIWTPPRDVVVPPLPRRAAAVAAAGLALLAGLVLLFVVPAVDDAKRRGAAQEARRSAAAARAEAVRLRRDQRATTARLAAGALVPQVAARIQRDARARLQAGELEGRGIRGVDCEAPEPASRGRLSLQCVAVTLDRSRDKRPLKMGYPFVAVVSADRRRVTWCKENLMAAEGLAYLQRMVRLPPGCRT